jgi:CcmD family protein
MRKLLSLIIAICACFGAMAQDMQPVSSVMESNLKLYVVVAVLAIIFSGIILFLLSLDKRLKKLEEVK